MEMKTDGFLRNVPLCKTSLSEELCESLSDIGINDLEDLSLLQEEDFYLLPFMNDTDIRELRNVIPSSFHDSHRPDEEVLREIPLSLLPLSNHVLNVLPTYGIRSAYDLMEKEDFFLSPVPGLGLKSMKEITDMILRLKEDRRFPDLFIRFLSSGCLLLQNGNIQLKNTSLYVKDVSLTNVFSDLSLENFLKNHGFLNLSDLLLSMEGLSSLKGVGLTKYQRIKKGIEDYINKNIHVVQSNEKQAYLKKREDILLLIEKDPSKGIFRKELYEKEGKEEVDSIIESLLREGKVDITMEGRILCHYPSINEVLKRYSYERYSDMVKEKLQGKTLEEIARKEGVTRERVRQRIVKFLDEHCKNSLYFEDRFRYLFTTYFTDEKSFTDITQCESFTYYYLVLRYQKGEKSLQEAFYDESLLLEIRERIFSCGYANLIRIEGELIRKSRSSLLDFYITHHLNVIKRLEDINREYTELALSYGEDFTYPNIHSLENKLVNHPFIIFLGHHCFRYYDYSSYDYQNLLDDIRLESYHDTFFSSEFFYRRNPSLMKEYDIRDKNELFSLLKRLYCENKDIHFIDMPYIIIGSFNRKEYLLSILKEYGELTTKDFAKILDERLGISLQGAIWLTDIKEYMMKRGVFLYDIKKEDHDDLSRALEGKLKEDFYFKKELSNIIPDVDIESIPNAVYDRFGYLSYSSYILKSSYDAKSYFHHILSKDEVITEETINKYRSVTMFLEVFYALRKQDDLIEYEKGKFLSFGFLEKKGYEKNDIREYTDKVYERMDDSFFTMKNVREKNIGCRLDASFAVEMPSHSVISGIIYYVYGSFFCLSNYRSHFVGEM